MQFFQTRQYQYHRDLHRSGNGNDEDAIIHLDSIDVYFEICCVKKQNTSLISLKRRNRTIFWTHFLKISAKYFTIVDILYIFVPIK